MNSFTAVAVCALDESGLITESTDSAKAVFNNSPDGLNFDDQWIESTEHTAGKIVRSREVNGVVQRFQIEFISYVGTTYALFYLIPNSGKVRALEEQLRRMEQIVLKLANPQGAVTVNTGDEITSGRDAWKGDRSEVSTNIAIGSVVLIVIIALLSGWLAVRNM